MENSTTQHKEVPTNEEVTLINAVLHAPNLSSYLRSTKISSPVPTILLIQ